MALRLKRRRDAKLVTALLPVPAQFATFRPRLPDQDKAVRFVALESVIELFLDQLFPDHAATGVGMFRILRDSDVEVEEEAEDLVR